MTDDERQLRALTAGALDAISWREGTAPDWTTFFAPYLDGALLCPSARPASAVTPDAFRARMEAQRASNALRALEERALGTSVQVFGNVAVVLSAYEARVNGGTPGRGVNAYLCVKDAERWKIAAVAWDNESADVVLPPALATPAP